MGDSKHPLSRLNGSGVKIAIIDSGYSPGRKPANVIDGVSFTSSTDQEVTDDWNDRIGHGTACTGIIQRKAPSAEFYPVKIFDNELVADVECFHAALEWCINSGVHIVNLSLGTTEDNKKEELRAMCDVAHRNGIVIVAAASNDSRKSYPAYFDNVLGVNAGSVRGDYEYFYDSREPVQFIARGDRQRLDWVDGKQVYMGGTSFAAPHIVGIIALLLQRFSGISYAGLSDVLAEYSLADAPPFVDGESLYSIKGGSPGRLSSGIELSDLANKNQVKRIKKAVLYPYNKEMHSLVRYRDLLSFEISTVVDVVGKRTAGKDCGLAIGADETGLMIETDLQSCLKDCDTLILGYLDQLSRIKGKDMLREALCSALEYQKHVYSLTHVSQENYPEVFESSRKAHLRVCSPSITFSDFEAITGAFDWQTESRKPILGVFGTGPQQGKFTVQLALRRELQSQGYRIGQLGTEHQSELFGFDYTFPNGYDSAASIQIPMDLHITLLHSVMAGIERSEPDLIIVGGQSGLIPHSSGEKSSGYTLPSLILLMGTQPDAYVLVVNSIDEMNFIRETMQVLEGVGKGKVVLLVFSNQKKEVRLRLGKPTVSHRPHSKNEIHEISRKLEENFGIPATEIISDSGRAKMVEAVIGHFEDNGD